MEPVSTFEYVYAISQLLGTTLPVVMYAQLVSYVIISLSILCVIATAFLVM